MPDQAQDDFQYGRLGFSGKYFSVRVIGWGINLPTKQDYTYKSCLGTGIKSLHYSSLELEVSSLLFWS
jgi:hypothetical protein